MSEPEPLLTGGYNHEEVRAISRAMLLRLEQIVAAKVPPDDRIKMLDLAFRTATRAEKVALREAAFLRCCGF